MNEILIYTAPDSQTQVEVKLGNETVWLSQEQMALLFKQTKQNVSLHINNIYKERELTRKATVKDSLTVQKEGKRLVSRKIDQYNLDVIISVGYRVKSKQGTQFRQWATQRLKDYLVNGYALNADRLKQVKGLGEGGRVPSYPRGRAVATRHQPRLPFRPQTYRSIAHASSAPATSSDSTN